MVRTADELSATSRYRELTTSQEDISDEVLRELAEHMTPREAVEQLTATVDQILTGGAHSEQRPGVLYKIFEEDVQERLPRITLERDSMVDNDGGQGDHFKVSFDYQHVSGAEGAAHTTHTGDDYEWRQNYDTRIQGFHRNGTEGPYTDPAGEVRVRAADATHRGSQVFNKMTVREINSTPIEENFTILQIAEQLRRRAEGRTKTHSQITADVREQMGLTKTEASIETPASAPAQPTRKKFGQTVLSAFKKLRWRNKS